MDYFELQSHITAAATVSRPIVLRGLTADLVSYCWPGGRHDRYNPPSVAWVREWGPLRSGAGFPVCSCASGHCDLCN
ncbi:MAG: hypothetical protein ACJ780_04525 [Solirubrobacteraceae bacterium]